MRQRDSRKLRQEERNERLSAVIDSQAVPTDQVWDELARDREHEHRAGLTSELGPKNAGGAH